MDQSYLKNILEDVAQGGLSPQAAMERLKSLPYEDLGFANIDEHRNVRTGYPETIFCQGKTPEQTAKIILGMTKANSTILATRASPDHYEAVARTISEAASNGGGDFHSHSRFDDAFHGGLNSGLDGGLNSDLHGGLNGGLDGGFCDDSYESPPSHGSAAGAPLPHGSDPLLRINDLELTYHEAARIILVQSAKEKGRAPRREKSIAVITAGTSDIPVAEEAAITAEAFGNPVDRIYDVGVAGIHRLFARLPLIRKANVIIVVAGMEGALASVVGGLADKPVIAVPTSVGYGASFGGVAALLAMLNSCAAGVGVVNIDNGFGAACLASSINRL